MKTQLKDFITKTIEGDYTHFINNGKHYNGEVMIVRFTDKGVHYTIKDTNGNTHEVVNDSIITLKKINLNETANSF